jgi:hypothetical protein
MRRSKDIEALSVDAKSVRFPQQHEHDSLNDFGERLRELVRENFGPDAAKDLSYQAWDQKYVWVERFTVSIDPISEIVMVLEIGLDPRRPLKSEFARIASQYESFKRRREEVCLLLARHLGYNTIL